MSMWSEVADGLHETSLWQLLFAFVACTGYVLVHGRMVEARLRWSVLAMTATALLAFLLEADRWVDGVMLIALGVAALGVFVAMVWLLCSVLGMTATESLRSFDSLLSVPPSDPDPEIGPGRALPAPRQAAPSH